MRITPVVVDNYPDFKQYCLEYGKEHDPSFTDEEELSSKTFADEGEIGYLLLDEDNTVIGTASLMTDRYRVQGTARFRVFHCRTTDPKHYQVLWAKFRESKVLADFQFVYLFMPDNKQATCKILEELGFSVSRYSWGLGRSTSGCNAPNFGNEWQLKAFRLNQDEWAWVEIINQAFAEMAGHVPSTQQRIQQIMTAPSVLPDGARILWNNDRPVGLLLVSHTEEQGESLAEIGPIAVKPEFQGKGIGRNLLRAAVWLAKEREYNRCWLSVNAENKRAADLYLKEGFVQQQQFICYSFSE